MFSCPDCGSKDYNIMDEDFQEKEGWIELICVCDNCETGFKVDADLKITEIEIFN